MSRALSFSIDQFDDLRRNISEDIEQWGKIVSKKNGHNMFCIWEHINSWESTPKNQRCENPELRNRGIQKLRSRISHPSHEIDRCEKESCGDRDLQRRILYSTSHKLQRGELQQGNCGKTNSWKDIYASRIPHPASCGMENCGNISMEKWLGRKKFPTFCILLAV